MMWQVAALVEDIETEGSVPIAHQDIISLQTHFGAPPARSARRVDIEITHFAGARAKCVQLVSMCMDEGHVPVDLARLGVRPPELAERVWRIAVSRLTMGQCASMST